VVVVRLGSSGPGPAAPELGSERRLHRVAEAGPALQGCDAVGAHEQQLAGGGHVLAGTAVGGRIEADERALRHVAYLQPHHGGRQRGQGLATGGAGQQAEQGQQTGGEKTSYRVF
jgi:hypothetical protein